MEVVMRRSWVVAFAPLLFCVPALAQEPPFPVPQVVVTVPQVVPIPVPVPQVMPLPVPVLQPVPVQQPPPVPPPQFEPQPWAYPPPEPPPPPPKKMRGVLLAIDFGAALPIRSPDTQTAGFGGDLRAGYRFAAGPVWLAPEATFGIVGFPHYDFAFRGGLGGHVGINGDVVEPSIYVFGGGFANFWKQGPGVRAGAALDFRAGRFVLPGVHVDYNYAEWDTNNVKYVGIGAHLGFLVGR
jgi:hypothetical protein